MTKYCSTWKKADARCLITLAASKAICLLRYILISYNLRFEEDHKTFSEMFFPFCDAVKDISIFCPEDFFAIFKDFIRGFAPTGGFISISQFIFIQLSRFMLFMAD